MKNTLKHPAHLCRWFITVIALTLTSQQGLRAQVTLAFQGAEPGDTWTFTSTGADATASANALNPANYVTGTASLVVGGNTSGGSCIDGGSGSGPDVARTFTFSSINISGSNAFTRTLVFNWGNRFPVCSGTGWDSGENLVFTAYHNGVAQPSVTLATGFSNAPFSIDANQYTYSIPPCVDNFYFKVSITTNRRDELLFLDDVKLTAPALNPPVLQPSAIAGTNTVCPGATENYTVTQVSGIIYTWSGLPAGASFVNPNGTTAAYSMNVNWGTAAPGNYTLSITPSDACGVVTGPPQTIAITVAAPVVASITAGGPLQFCAGDSVVLTANTSTGISWTPGGTDSIITVHAGGTYTLTVTGACNTATAAETITVLPATSAVITPGGPTTFCPGGSVVLVSSATTGNAWSTGDTTTSITVSTAGVYTLTVTDACGTATASQTIAITPVPTAVITPSGPTTFCAGGSVTLTSSDATGNSWSTGDTTQSITVTTGGIYTLNVNTICGTATASQTVTINPAPVAVITPSGPTTFCAGGSVTLTSSAATGNSWSTGPATASITVSTAGVYMLTVTNSCGSATASQTVTVNPLPSASISGTPTSLCAGDSVLLTATGGVSYLWSDGSNTPATYGFAPGNYTVTATNSCGSITSSPYVLTPLPNPVAAIGGATLLCQGGSLTLTASGGASYLWSTGSTGTSISIGAPGNYILTAINGCGTNVANVTIVMDSIVADFTANPMSGNAPLTVDFTNLSSAGAIGFAWDFGNGGTSTIFSPSTLYTDGGLYTVQLTAVTAAGCSDVHTLVIEVIQDPSVMIVPNIFTPNGDGVNDEFRVESLNLATFEAVVFNRWGVEISRWNDFNRGWDGTDTHGNKVAEGTYYYTIQAVGKEDKAYSQNGTVTLAR